MVGLYWKILLKLDDWGVPLFYENLRICIITLW